MSPIYVRDIRIGDVVTDEYYAPPTTLTVTAIRGGSTFTLWGTGDDGTLHTLYQLLPTNTLMKGRPS